MMANQELFGGLEIRRMALDDPCMPAFEQIISDGEMAPIDDDHCRRLIERLRDGTLFSEADVIVLTAHWEHRLGGSPHLGAMSLAETLAAQGRQVFMVGLLAMKDASSLAFLTMKRGLTVEQANEYAYKTLTQTRIDKPNADVRALAERVDNIGYLDKHALFCDDEKQTCLLYDDDKRLLFSDAVHVSSTGALYFGKRVAELGWFD
jgi:hypothetical protein